MMRFTLPAAAVLASLALPTYGLRADAGRPLLNADASAQAGCASLPTSRQGFHILPPSGGNVGRIVAPDGRLFVPRGVAIMQGNEPPVQTILATFPGINFIRYAIYDYPDPNQIAPWVNALTQAGLVVEIENHNNGGGNAGGAGGPVFTGALLDKESRWYADTAAFFKANPGVWFGTNNEPPGPGSALSRWHLATYDAIRGAGSSTIIMIDPIGAYDVTGLDPAAYAGMTNVAWDIHFYGWGADYSTDAAKVKATLMGFIQKAQAIKSAGGLIMPAIIGEYGDSTDGYRVDEDGLLVVRTVHAAVVNGDAAGSAAWVWAPPRPGDGLVRTKFGGLTSPYGTTVADYLRQTIPAQFVCTGNPPMKQRAIASPTDVQKESAAQAPTRANGATK